ncbi:MAG: hypothetical protein M0P69_11285 [Bacteroidales bacterium]|nr:hypothetical protein [Bacteroidales bacterium]
MYKLLLDRENAHARYYLLRPEGTGTFLGVEHYDNVVELKKRFLLPPKKKESEVTTLYTLLPINSAALHLLANYSQLSVKETIEKEGFEPELVYNVWDDEDIKDLANVYKLTNESLENPDDSWEFPEKVNNGIVEAFIDDGYSLFGVYHVHRFLRQYWLVRTSVRGFLSFTFVYEAGGVSSYTPKVDCYALPKEVVDLAIDELFPNLKDSLKEAFEGYTTEEE